MKKTILIILLAFSGLCLKAQTSLPDRQASLDSLYAVWLDETQLDSLRTTAFKAYISNGYINTDVDSAILLADELIDFGIERNYDRAKSDGYELKGYGYYQQSKFSQALENFKVALGISESIGREKFKGDLMKYIGAVYGTLGNDARAVEYFERALKVSEEVDDLENMEMCVSNIGGIYFRLENYPRALEYYERGMQLEKEMGDSIGYAMSLNLIAMVFRKQGDFSRALNYNEQALKINEAFDFTEGIVESFYSIGDTYKEQKKYSLALQYFKNGLQINDGSDSSEVKVASWNKIGDIHREQGDYPKALSYCNLSKDLASKIGWLIEQKNACECLYLVHRSLNNGNDALEYLEQIQVIDDSLNTQETNNRLQQMEIENQALKDSIAAAEKERVILVAHEEEVRQKNQTRNVLIGSSILIFALAGGIYSRLRYVRKSKATLQIEKDRSENLLLNILPADIAEELKIHGKAEARDFDMVSILFTDFKGFTEQSAKLSAAELVNEINYCFEGFDGIMEKYGIEKIKTIGDAYMAAGGLPIPTNDSTKNTVLAALEMQGFVSKRKVENDAIGQPAFEMRVGIHTGPVVAGIVGVKKFQYDIWGDTVNTAARMESAGEIAKVNLSQTTYELLKDDPQFTFESRGKIEAKGKGEIQMYYVHRSSE